MVRMENITDRELLTAYIRARYPQQDNTRAVCVIYLDEIEDESTMNMLMETLEECGVRPSGYFTHPGKLILEMPSGLATQLCNKMHKESFTILVYKDVILINENR